MRFGGTNTAGESGRGRAGGGGLGPWLAAGCVSPRFVWRSLLLLNSPNGADVQPSSLPPFSHRSPFTTAVDDVSNDPCPHTPMAPPFATPHLPGPNDSRDSGTLPSWSSARAHREDSSWMALELAHLAGLLPLPIIHSSSSAQIGAPCVMHAMEIVWK